MGSKDETHNKAQQFKEKSEQIWQQAQSRGRHAKASIHGEQREQQELLLNDDRDEHDKK
ncbi:hypothetical protein ACFV2N_47145 [Streptomyces sp. NPDC059680]|uniref:hypothetical protein n=1 Tax=Streptomyces sp. NPDC059680 TaxID=3346904 RepID=UPI0036A999F8